MFEDKRIVNKVATHVHSLKFKFNGIVNRFLGKTIELSEKKSDRLCIIQCWCKFCCSLRNKMIVGIIFFLNLNLEI